MKLLIYSLALFLLFCNYSCVKEKDRSVAFRIKNLSTKEVTDFKIYCSYGSTHAVFSDSITIFETIAPNDSISFNWKNPNLFESDGEFYIKTADLQQGFGYFSNGILLESSYDMAIYNDSIR